MTKRISLCLNFCFCMWGTDIFLDMKGNCKWGITYNLSWKWNAIFTISLAVVFKLPHLDIRLLTSHGWQSGTCVGYSGTNPRRSQPELTTGKGFIRSELLHILARTGQHWIAVRKADLPPLLLCWFAMTLEMFCSLGNSCICENLNLPEWDTFLH